MQNDFRLPLPHTHYIKYVSYVTDTCLILNCYLHGTSTAPRIVDLLYKSGCSSYDIAMLLEGLDLRPPTPPTVHDIPSILSQLHRFPHDIIKFPFISSRFYDDPKLQKIPQYRLLNGIGD
jgi:hypothetical protein